MNGLTRASGDRYVILVVDDEPAFQRLLHLHLTADGYDVLMADSGAAALRLLEEHHPDAVVLDLVMPGTSGMDVLVQIKQRVDVPVIVFTAKASEDVRAEALSLGADDVLAKRMSLEDLSTTLGLLLAHGAEALRDVVMQVGKAEVDLLHREVRLDGKQVRLSQTEWRLLQHLAEHRGRPRLNQELLTAVWGPEYREELQFLRLWVRRLATKLGDDAPGPIAIRDYMRIGYALNVEDT